MHINLILFFSNVLKMTFEIFTDTKFNLLNRRTGVSMINCDLNFNVPYQMP